MNIYLNLPFIFKMTLIFQCCFSAAEAKERIFAVDVQAFTNSSQTNVQALLDRLTPKSADFKNLTATTNELNILHGTNPTVTTQNLNTLTAGSTSNADSLHTHPSGVGNASTIDNLDSSQFVRSDVSDTFEGDLLTLGTSGNETGVALSGDLTVTGNITNPALILLEQEIYDLKKEMTDLKFAVQELLEKKVR